jgi:acyl-CoA thioesterase I
MNFMRQATKPICLFALLLSGACSSDDSKPDPNAMSSGGEATTGGSSSAGAGKPSTTGGKSNSAGSTGSAGKSGGAAGSQATGGSPPGGGEYLIPNPLVSQGKDVESSPDGGEIAFDGGWDFDSTWRAGPKDWLKINVGKGPTKLLFVWHTDSTPDYTIDPEINFGAPTAYVIEVSATGADGSWTKVAEVTGEPNDVSYRSAAHAFDFTGMSYVRWTMNKLVSTQGNLDAQLNEIEIHDISNGSEDTWAVVGLGQSRSTYHGHAELFPALIHQAHPDYYPALIDLAEAGGQAKDLVTEIDELLRLNPDFHFWVLAYGMGDAENNRSPDETDFKASMQKVIDKLKAAGKVPLFPRLEKVTHDNHTTTNEFNAVIDQLVLANDLPPAPDLYPLFSDKPALLCTVDCEEGHFGLDFTPEGVAAVNELWATTLDPLYAP